MNKTIIININGIVFHIEEDAYEVLRYYMIEVKKHFGYTTDSQEIVNDIENRIAEMFNERIQEGKKEVITMLDVQEVCAQMGRVSDFETGEAGYNEPVESPFNILNSRTERKLFRDADDRVFGGVCSGLGHYFDMEPRWVRVIFVLLFLFGGTGMLLYVILWIVMPPAKSRADRMAMRGEAPNLQNFKRNFDEEMEGLRENFSGAEDGFKRGLNSAGNFLAKVFIILVKIVGIFFIIGACGGLIVLVISIFASFGIFGTGSRMAMFPFNVIEPEWRNGLLIGALITAIIPIVALIFLAIRILFNRAIIGRYTGFTLLVMWIIAIGFTAFYATKTLADFKEGSTVVEDRQLERHPVLRLTRNDVTLIKLDANKADSSQDVLQIKRRVSIRHNSLFEGLHEIRMQILQADSLQAPSLTEEFSARGTSFDEATKRAGSIKYHFVQQGEILQFNSHFALGDDELMRDQKMFLKLSIPVGTRLFIDRDLERHIWDLPFNQCAENYKYQHGNDPQATEWVMTSGGLKCAIAPPPEEPDQPVAIDTSASGLNRDSLKTDTIIQN